MKNLKLTEWLQIVWNALAESDEAKRSSMLHAADTFLQTQVNEQPPAMFYQVEESRMRGQSTRMIRVGDV